MGHAQPHDDGRDQPRDPDRELWERYELEKRQLREQDLSPAEYDRRIHEITERLGI